jgi:hypothetical protein
MRTFKDNNGIEWLLSINIQQVKRVRALAGVDLMEVGVGKLDVIADYIRMVDVLFVLCKKQAEERQIDDAKFAAGMGGDSIEFAQDALMEELIDFFPPRQRKLLAEIWEKTKKVADEAATKAMEKMAAIDFPLSKNSGDGSGPVPGSSE